MTKPASRSLKKTVGLDREIKLEGYINGMPVYSDPIIEEGVMYMLNPECFDVPRTKKGKPDMRYSINKLSALGVTNDPI